MSRVKCDICGAEIERRYPKEHNFCCADHRILWSQMHTDFSAISRRHCAKHLTELNRKRNPFTHIADRGNGSSSKARETAAAGLGRTLVKGEVVHHINGNSEDNTPDNLLVMTDRQHRQLHMALAIERYEDVANDEGGEESCPEET